MARGKVIKATFGARRKLEALERELPELDDDDEEGDQRVRSDGKVARFLRVKDGAWVVMATFNADTLIDYLLSQRAARNRLLRRIGCEKGHDWKRRRCTRCKAEQAAAWHQCRSTPFASAEDVLRGAGPDGQRLYRLSDEAFLTEPTCRRRDGHDGPCGWQKGNLEHHVARFRHGRHMAVISMTIPLSDGEPDMPEEET